MQFDKEYTISLKFPCLASMVGFLVENGEMIEKSQTWITASVNNVDDDNVSTCAIAPKQKKPKNEKRENEKRGAHTKEKHVIAREYHTNHPE